ncbi:MAG TPA: response regulator [Dissulfurispiraceae bacterium]|nr:response regulator [Dissulfurispiraceae bacterium]
MLTIRERMSVDQSTNFVDTPGEIGLSSNVRSILIADEDRDVLNQLSQSFAICAKQYNIYTAQNCKDALEVLKTSSVNIFIAALNISTMHDFLLIDYAKYHHPATKLFVMSEEDPSFIKKILGNLNIYGYISKPIRIEMVYSILRI